MTPINALSIDLEEWFHAELLRRVVPPEARRFGQAAAATRRLLALLAEHGVLATFFIVGEIIEHEPDLVREIAAAGHEIGCHGLTHRPLWELDATSFADELHGWQAKISECLGRDFVQEVWGFRAPAFSLDRTTSWALTVLSECGFRYDSSIFPKRNHVYGVRGASTIPYRPAGDSIVAHDPHGQIVEFPMSVTRLFGTRIPISGGFYLRVLPLSFVSHGCRRLNEVGRPFNLYLHPWEVWDETPRLPLAPVDQMITYYNVGAPMFRKLQALLSEFHFAPIREVLAQYGILEGDPIPPGRAQIGAVVGWTPA